ARALRSCLPQRHADRHRRLPRALPLRPLRRQRADRDDLLARRSRPARLRGGRRARLPGRLRHALRLRAPGACDRASQRPDLCARRSADRLREAGRLMALSPLNQRRWRNFKANRRAFWSLWNFLAPFALSLAAELVANDKPLPVSYRGALSMPAFRFYPVPTFGGDFKTEAIYRDPAVQCLIRTGGLEACWDDPEGVMADAADGEVAGAAVEAGWMVWPLIPYSYSTVNNVGTAPS